MPPFLREPDPFKTSPDARGARAPVVRVAARTDPGRQRQNNEDRALVVRLPSGVSWGAPSEVLVEGASGLVVAVCDGMGGEAGGEIASRLAVECLAEALPEAWSRLSIGAPRPLSDVDARLGRALVHAVELASERVRAVAEGEASLARMGTTATVGAFGDGVLVCAQVGDSRAYVLRGGRLVQVTRDQTVAELLRQRALDDASVGVGDHIVLQAVGASSRLEVALSRTPVGPGDVILLCSDGLSGVVCDDVIAALLATHEDPEAACDALVAAANACGGPDNVTCIVVKL